MSLASAASVTATLDANGHAVLPIGIARDGSWMVGGDPLRALAAEAGIALLCLLLIRPIGSRRPPEVFVMESTDAWPLHHPALTWRVHTPWLGRVLGQR